MYKSFWDDLASRLVQFGARLLVGDFNMSLWCVVVELRARGFQINLAAWYPFYMVVQEEMMVDSIGMFCIGPWQGIKLIYDCSLFEVPPPPRSDNNSMVMEENKDDNGKVIGRKPYEAHSFKIQKDNKAQGYVLDSYLPKSVDGLARRQYLKWNFDCVADNGEDSAVAELKKGMRENANMFYKPNPDFSTGKESWEWSSMTECKQQLVKRNKFDPSDRYFRGGAHMPLMVFICKRNGTRRSVEGPARRQTTLIKEGTPQREN